MPALIQHTVCVRVQDNNRPSVSTSPSNGNNDASDPIPSSPGIANGDIHFYTNADCWNPSTWPRSRFTSEYGFNSFPSYITMTSAMTSPTQANFSDPFWAWRDHSGGDNAINTIRYQVGLHYPSPVADTYIRDWLWMSQVR